MEEIRVVCKRRMDQLRVDVRAVMRRKRERGKPRRTLELAGSGSVLANTWLGACF